VCDGDVTIRNNSGFEDLKQCRILEGSLSIRILEMDESIGLPLLTEIKGYLLIYRVQNLKSLNQLFPNLAVIRGNELYKDNALIISNNNELENVGLQSLVQISRGAVRIENNPRLCFVDTINWKLLLNRNYHELNVMKVSERLHLFSSDNNHCVIVEQQLAENLSALL